MNRRLPPAAWPKSEFVGGVGVDTAAVGGRGHQLRQPLLVLHIGYVFYGKIGALAEFGGSCHHGRYADRISTLVGGSQIEEAPGGMAAQPFPNRRPRGCDLEE